MRPFLLLLACVAVACSASAQTTVEALRARLLNEPLYLRGFPEENHLQYGADGKPVRPYLPTSWTLSGVQIEKLDLRKDELVLSGHRRGVTIKDDVVSRVDLLEPADAGQVSSVPVEIRIALPDGGDFGPALDAVFASEPYQLVASLPEEWQQWAQIHLQPEPAPAGEVHLRLCPACAQQIGQKAPVPLKTPEPQFTPEARAMGYSGDSKIYLQISPSGTPDHVAIRKPLGLGLDEAASSAVRSYRFKPAMQGGVPVRVEMLVQVNFQLK